MDKARRDELITRKNRGEQLTHEEQVELDNADRALTGENQAGVKNPTPKK